MKQAVADLDPVLLVEEVARQTERPRFVAWLLSAFAGLALLLAAAGLYGVASYLVTQRMSDIGVRLAQEPLQPIFHGKSWAKPHAG